MARIGGAVRFVALRWPRRRARRNGDPKRPSRSRLYRRPGCRAVRSADRARRTIPPGRQRAAGRARRSGSRSASISGIDLLPRRHVGHARARAERGLVERVERRQPARKELAKDRRARQGHRRRGSRAGSPSTCRPSATRRLLRDPSVDSRLRTTIQSIRHRRPAAADGALADHLGVVAFVGDRVGRRRRWCRGRRGRRSCR